MPPPLSRRVVSTDAPVIADIRALVDATPGCASLSQGACYYSPPPAALEAAAAAATDPATSSYGPDLGTPALRAAVGAHLAAEHGLDAASYRVAITPGANLAVGALALALLDPGDAAACYAPAYFNATMAVQLAGAEPVFLPCDANWWPDLGATRARLTDPALPRVRSVYLVTPGNPTGVTVPDAVVAELVAITRAAGAWLILDGTYLAFSSTPITLPSAPHVIHVGSFSKAYGSAGWRVGYIAYPASPADGAATDSDPLGSALLKILDTLPIHAAHASQALALACLQHADAGPGWVARQVATLEPSRAAARAALAPLGDGAVAGGDAIYFWARLPIDDDWAFVRWAAAKHRVAVVPGSACGTPGCIRVAFAKPPPGPEFEEAARRLRAACAEVVKDPTCLRRGSTG